MRVCTSNVADEGENVLVLDGVANASHIISLRDGLT